MEKPAGRTIVEVFDKRLLTTVAVPWPRQHPTDEETTVPALSLAGQTPVATIVVETGDDDPALEWSPDSRKLAIAGTHRIWIYDLDARKMWVVKAWRRGIVLPPSLAVLWSHDSREFYFAHSFAVEWIGLEIVRVRLLE